MPREVSSIGPQNNPQQPRSFQNKDAGIGDRKGSGGQGRGKEQEPEPETDEQAADEATLDEDHFAAGKKNANLQHFLNDKLPWEQAEDERQRKLEAIKQKRMGTKGTGPLGAGREMLKPPVLPPRATGRQVDGGFDATAAVNNTFQAHQSLRDRQAQARRAAEPPQPPAQAPTSRLGRMLTGTDTAPADRTEPLEAPEPPAGRAWPVQTPPAFESIVVPPPAAPQPVAPPAPTPSRPAPPAARQAPPAKPATGPLKPPVRGAGPLKSLGGTLAPEPPEPQAPVARPAAPAPEPPPPPPVAEVVEPAPAPVAVEPPAPVPEAPPAPTHLVEVRVFDGDSGHSIPGARLEFEPTVDALLAIVNAQTDTRGAYRSDDVAPGHYQLAVRYPGYIPYSQTLTLVAGQPVQLEIRMSKP